MHPDPIYAFVAHRPIAAVSALVVSLSNLVSYPQPSRTAGKSLPTARQFVAGSVLGNVLYIAGGTTAATPITSTIGPGDALVYGYAFATDAWASGEIV